VRSRHAYVFYATDDAYGVAVLVFVRRLRQLGLAADADVLVLHLPLSPPVVARMDELGIQRREVTGFRQRGGYFKDSLVKLRIFELTEYDRVVYLDADALPLRNLDFLSTLPFNDPVAAPSAYWLPQPFWTTALLVVQPSEAIWNRIGPHLERPSARWHDMDIVNRELAGEVHPLPSGVFSLNSEWEDVNRRGYFGDPVETYGRVAVVHFTALGKPWSYSDDEVRSLRPDAHEIFVELWATWRKTRAEILAGR
jgi:alpha-N-acetylglucosamine transferase